MRSSAAGALATAPSVGNGDETPPLAMRTSASACLKATPKSRTAMLLASAVDIGAGLDAPKEPFASALTNDDCLTIP